jgi:hypothetical protein
MNAKTFVVQHEWDSARTGEVLPVVTKIIENAKAGKLPCGDPGTPGKVPQ